MEDINHADETKKDDHIVLVPFESQYTVSVVETAKNGESVSFVLSVIKRDGTEKKCTRDFEDFEYLHHCLRTHIEHDGHIIPPLPPHPITDAKSAELKSKSRYGDYTKYVAPDLLQIEARNVEKYLELLVCHPMFGTHPSLIIFLTGSLLPVRTKVQKGWMAKMTDKMEEAWKGSHRDVDSFFQDTRKWATNYSTAVNEAAMTFNKLSDSDIRLSCAFSEFEKELLADEGNKTLQQLQISQICIKLAEAMEDIRRSFEVLCSNNEATLGFELDLYSRYFDNVMEVLFRRTCLLIEYENANKIVEKSKPVKRQEAETTRDKAEAQYDKCTEILKKELKRLDQQRLVAFREAMVKMAETEAKVARDTYALLLRTTNQIKNA